MFMQSLLIVYFMLQFINQSFGAKAESSHQILGVVPTPTPSKKPTTENPSIRPTLTVAPSTYFPTTLVPVAASIRPTWTVAPSTYFPTTLVPTTAIPTTDSPNSTYIPTNPYTIVPTKFSTIVPTKFSTIVPTKFSTIIPTKPSTNVPTTVAPSWIPSTVHPSISRRPAFLKTKNPTVRPSFVSTNATTTKSTSTSTKGGGGGTRTRTIIIAVVVSVGSCIALVASYFIYRRYKYRDTPANAQFSYPESGNLTSNVGDSENLNGHETSSWLPVGPTIASKNTKRKGKDTQGYSDIAMVDIYGAGGSPMDGNDNSRVILSPFAPKKNQKDSARDMTTVNFFDDEEL